MRNPLDKTLRSQLEKAVEKARDTAELAAREELQRLAVGDKAAADYLTEPQRQLRNRLRTHARQLGDIRRADGEQEIELLVTEIAYEHWHRMLFSRFLAENNLLMYEDGTTPLTISDCFELAEEETGDSSNGWRYASNYAANMLPQIFRNDSPVFELEFAPNHQKKLEQQLEELDESTFQAQDSLGWVYQFWQSKRKDEVNKSEVKIGARELSPVTQLFTEPYMVSFLLDNALGAWWANQQLTDQDYATAQSEAELREKVAIDGVPLEYLRFIKTYTPQQQATIDKAEEADEHFEKPEPTGPWEPAAGKFEQWPEHLSELKTLDPCCGSGHFLVAVFLMLVPLRMQREGLTEQQAIDAVLSDNIHGLEIDQRCIEIAAFALALEAWRYPNGGGYRKLPELHLACSGLSVKAAKEEWKQLGLGKKNLGIALDWLHKEFSDAPVLGSLINPAKSNAASIVSWGELSDTLSEALKQESNKDHHSEDEQKSLEAAVAAQGLAKAATMLAGQYQWVVTNVPYLSTGKQSNVLKNHLEKKYPSGRHDLATAFLERCLDFCITGGVSSVVLPQNWLFLKSYKKLREKLLSLEKWNFLAKLGAGSFETISGEVVKAVLINLTRCAPGIMSEGLSAPTASKNNLRGLDVSDARSVDIKSKGLLSYPIKSVSQESQKQNPEMTIMLEDVVRGELLSTYASALSGCSAGDSPRFIYKFWEVGAISKEIWRHHQGTCSSLSHFGGQSEVIFWENQLGQMFNLAESVKHLNHAAQNWLRGKPNWGKKGVVVSQMGNLLSTIYTGEIYDCNCCAIIPNDEEHVPALWAYCESGEFNKEVRKLNQKMNVTPKTLLNVPFDYDYWQEVAQDKYPNDLPSAYSDEPVQGIFHGHPCGSVIWDEKTKRTVKSELRVDESVLQVAAARLLGYQWPAELDPAMELADEQREWVDEAKKLLAYVDDDGIVCLPVVRGEKAADERLEELLQAAYGDSWSTQIRNQLLEAVGCKNKTLAHWLREKFFEQHCKQFQHRPFIWHIWDGLKDGFGALVNYHQLDKKNLERLIYTYLDDWIRTQSHQQSEGVDGANERFVAAQNLKKRLEQILEGEAPYDIFVRWKSLAEQSIGWNPDLNDGVRLNIRPFMTAEVLRHNKKPKLNIQWNKDRGKDVESAPWYELGLEYGGKEGDRINDHHLSLEEKLAALDKAKEAS